jgi:hypothetical protein
VSRTDRDSIAAPLDQPVRMSAYYYSFDETGVAIIDQILSAVAHAGKAYHHTDCWTETNEWTPVSYAEQIQRAANAAAGAIREYVASVEDAQQVRDR